MIHSAIERDAPAAIRLFAPHGEERALSRGLPVSRAVSPRPYRVTQVATARGLGNCGIPLERVAVGLVRSGVGHTVDRLGVADDRVSSQPLEECAAYAQRLRGLSEGVLRLDDGRRLGFCR